jgi:hypothetical protein
VDGIDPNFVHRCVGVFDTVGSLGMPVEMSLHWKATTTIFGFPDKKLSPDIANAFQALAINENRVDFVSRVFSEFCGLPMNW